METTPMQTKLGRTAYITQATAASIINKIPAASFQDLAGVLYRRPIYIFSRMERIRLLAIQQFFQSTETFINSHYQKAFVGMRGIACRLPKHCNSASDSGAGQLGKKGVPHLVPEKRGAVQ